MNAYSTHLVGVYFFILSHSKIRMCQKIAIQQFCTKNVALGA